MPKIAYEDYSPRGDTLPLIDQSIAIIDDYQSRGYELTLRQLYYQLVARAVIPNVEDEHDDD